VVPVIFQSLLSARLSAFFTRHPAVDPRPVAAGRATRTQGMALRRRGAASAVFATLLAALLAGAAAPPAALAQTANFSGVVSTLGSGFNYPTGVAVDASGDLFVADQSNSAVKEIVAGTGGAASGQVNSSSTVTIVGSGFSEPAGVAVDASGDVFVADQGNSAVKEIVAGTGARPAARSTPARRSLSWAAGSTFPTAWRWTREATSSSRITATVR